LLAHLAVADMSIALSSATVRVGPRRSSPIQCRAATGGNRDLPGERPPSRSSTVYGTACAACHGADLKGVMYALISDRWSVRGLRCYAPPPQSNRSAPPAENFNCALNPSALYGAEDPMASTRDQGRCSTRRRTAPPQPHPGPARRSYLTPRRNRFRQRPVQVRTRLSAGERWIRTSSSAPNSNALRRLR
jgi:hypothetical protein